MNHFLKVTKIILFKCGKPDASMGYLKDYFHEEIDPRVSKYVEEKGFHSSAS
jgi:hypothetical protein